MNGQQIRTSSNGVDGWGQSPVDLVVWSDCATIGDTFNGLCP
jgi:hypothetical protein